VLSNPKFAHNQTREMANVGFGTLGTPGMLIVGLAGWSGSGKTTLLAALIPELVARGLSVSTIKHAHHEFDIDRPGKDSWRHREAGATEVMVGSARRWALMHELRGDPEPPLDELIARMSPVDLVLVEGFKRQPHPKLEIHRPSLGKPLIYPEDPHVVAIATDEPFAGPLPLLPLADAAAIAAFIIDHFGVAAWRS
jgi:molybdopterin-guanine dinucleotide biosynthesis adapter protein